VILSLVLLIGLVLTVLWFVAPKGGKQVAHQESAEGEATGASTTGLASSDPGPSPTPAQTLALPSTTKVPLDELQLMAQLRRVKDANPDLAIQLAREGNRRFPDSADAPERTSILIHSLSNLNRSSEARGEAEEMVNHYPDSSWVREIEQFTGAHRHRNIRVNSAGELEYY